MKSPGPEETWTDGLPVCYHSGVGFSTNQRYREDGYHQEEHRCEDRSFHFKLGDNTYLYGIFDGHYTGHAADIAFQRIPAELALGQLQDKTSSEHVRAILHQAFQQVEKEFFESIGDLLAERASLQLELQQYGNQYEAVKNAPEKVQRLENINNHISSGTSALVALVHNNMIYFANIGTSRALLCQHDGSGVLRVHKVTADHTVENENELARLADLGLCVEQLRNKKKLLGNQVYTRCLGDYSVKGGYKQFFESLSTAISEPVIAEPEIHGGVPLDGGAGTFLILMSDGVYTALEHATDTVRANLDIASMVANEFTSQSTLNGVAQAVIDRIVRMHHDAYALAAPDDERKQTCQRHDDMTLLVRNFGYPMRHGGGGAMSSVASSPSESRAATTGFGCDTGIFRQSSQTAATITPMSMQPDGDTDGDVEKSLSQTYGTLGVSDDADRSTSLEQTTQSLQSLKLDSEGRVPPYVSFAEYYEISDKWTEEEKRRFEDEYTPRMDHNSIVEGIEPGSPEPQGFK